MSKRRRRRPNWTKRALNVGVVVIVLLVALPDLLRFGRLPFFGRAVEGSRDLPPPAPSTFVHIPSAMDRGIANPGWPNASFRLLPDAVPSPVADLAAAPPPVLRAI